jgi:predicted amidohydrolase
MHADSRLEHLAFLRGLCRRAVPDFFERTEAAMLLDRGMPIPFATRPVRALFGQTTPYQPTLAVSGLLEGLGHGLFEHAASGPIRVVLDFGFRDRLDELTWSRGERLPQIATLHLPLDDADLAIGEIHDEWFFDVRPRDWRRDTVLERLRAVADAEIAVLPELSLPAPDALEADLADDPARYPPLVVAGSAHVREPAADGAGELRANEARVYLDGRLAAVHRKIHAFSTRHLNGVTRARPWVEGITAEPKTITILSGTHTRLAVVICADLNDEASRIPGLLEAAGVNLLLVPALTDRIGAFNGAATGIASRCQGVAVIVNGDRANGSGEAPFLALAAVPRPAPRDQVRLYPEDEREPRGSLGILDPNLELCRAMSWRSPA